MNPTLSQVHVNTPLTNLSVAMIQSPSAFIADQVFPVIPVSKQTDIYYKYPRGYFNKSQMQKRSLSSESQGADYKAETDTYRAEIFALHKDIDDAIRANADSQFKLDSEAALFLTHQGLLAKEILWGSTFFTTSVWGTDITGVAAAPGAGQVLQWNDSASTPIENVRAGKTAVLQSTGFRPNTLVLGQAVYDALVDHPDLIDRVKYGQTSGGPAMVNRNVLAQLFEVDRVLVAEAIQNTANEAQTASHSFILGKKALLCYVPPSPGLMTPASGYTFTWNQYEQAALGTSISRFRMEHLRSDRVEINMAYGYELVATELGYFFTSIVA
jgi:hypothetical protein